MESPGLPGRFTAAVPEVGVVALTTFDDDTTIFGALRAEARGYMLKDAE
jgi:DNA-binding NarL/FixJ family response regulator